MAERKLIDSSIYTIEEYLKLNTEAYDRGEKFRRYCSLVSFREYVLIDARQPIVDVLYREAPGEWKMRTAIGIDKSVYIDTIDSEITLRDLYRNTLNTKGDATVE